MTGAWSAWPEVPEALEELNIKDKASDQPILEVAKLSHSSIRQEL
jgi:hypothetical protein